MDAGAIRRLGVFVGIIAVFILGALAAREKTSQKMLPDVTARPPDAFYDVPTQVTGEPGILLASEPLRDVTLPTGMRGWRIKYTTTVDDKTPTTAVATVFAPTNAPEAPRPVVIWEHGTTGLLQKCMPSLMSNPTLGIPALNSIVQRGWVIVATDYSFAEKNGPHPYMIGEGEARAGLDSVRAARKLPELKLGTDTVVWGHSQGGQSALWTGILAPQYAPDVQVVGVAAIAPVADIKNLVSMNPLLDKRLGPYLAASYSRYYPEIKFDEAIRPEALKAASEIASLCGFLPPEDPKRQAYLATTFDGPALALETNKAFADRLAQNAATHPVSAPLLIAQGLADVVVLPKATDIYVEGRCAAGQRLEYWTFDGLDHGEIVQPGTRLDEPLIEWTAARFGGEPQREGCRRISL